MEYYMERIETDEKVPARIFYGGSGLDKLRYPLHWHRNLEFDLVLEGCIRGRIKDAAVEVHEGEVFFVNSGELHETDASGSGRMRAVTILLSDQILREYCPDLDDWYFVVENGSGQQRKLAELIERCARVEQSRQPFYELELSVVLRQICIVLLRECRAKREQSEAGQGTGKSLKRIKEAISHMEANYENVLSIQEMAGVMGMAPSYFSRFFRQCTGQTFHSYLTQIRLCHAMEQMMAEECSVTELAMDNGFPNVKSFIDSFRREYGMTPAKYRRCKK